MIRTVIQAGNIAELLPARIKKYPAILLIDFFERLQAVSGKAGTHNIHTAHTGRGQFL